MDISSAASSISQAKVAQSISTEVAKKSMDAMKQQGQAAMELLQAAAAVGKQGASPDGIGRGIDVSG